MNEKLKNALAHYRNEGRFHSSVSTYKTDGYMDLVAWLQENGENYGETSITGGDMVVYNADIYDSGLRTAKKLRNIKSLDESLNEGWSMPKLKRDRAKVKGSAKYKSYGSWTKILGGKNLMTFESYSTSK